MRVKANSKCKYSIDCPDVIPVGSLGRVDFNDWFTNIDKGHYAVIFDNYLDETLACWESELEFLED